MSDKQAILKKLFLGTKQLPTLPVLVGQLNKMMDNPFASTSKISELIMKDQTMVAKILKLSNSALYSRRQEITNLSSAITFLGMNILRNLILQISLVRLFDIKDTDLPEFSINTFWEHSLGTAYFTDVIVKKLNIPHNDNYYLGGLLHDLGKLVIYQSYPAEFKRIVKNQIECDLIDIDAEEEVLGVNHADVGTFLAEQWQFKREIVDSIRDHHKAQDSLSLTAAVVRISNLFTKAAGLCFPWDKRVFEIAADPGWDILARHRTDSIDVERLTFEITDESSVIQDSVRELLNKRS